MRLRFALQLPLAAAACSSGASADCEARDASGGGYYDTDDHGIDIVIAADGKWEWKDHDDPRLMAEEGRLTSEEAVAVMRCAHQVAADLDAGRRWWSVWDEWEPPKGI